MSRVGKKPISIPEAIKIVYKDHLITVEGKKGKLARALHPGVNLEIDKGTISVKPVQNDRIGRSLQGLTRSLVANMIAGVAEGFERVLEINGIGYRAATEGNQIVFNLGYSNPIRFPLPEGIEASVEKNNIVKLTGIDKEKLGQTAAAIRRLRPPEPYKGKGIRYAGEYVQRKAGKTGTK